MDNYTATKLSLIAKKAKQDKQCKFTSLMHHFTFEHLLSCFKDLKSDKAPGIDNRTKESYSEQEIKQILIQTVAKMKARKYKPQPVKRVYINKTGNKQRPLGIPTVTDKIVQAAAKNILEAIYEQDFLDCSYGYRPNRSAHQALKQLNHTIMQKKVNWIIDADIQSFFDNIDHYIMMDFLSHRIRDAKFKSLIFKFMKSGIFEEDRYIPTKQGTPQGSIISPILANIYLHYVLDLWFEKVLKKQINGEVCLIRYADDFIIATQYQDQARKVLNMLKQRLIKFKLTLSEDKTRLIEFGRFAQENKHRLEQRKPDTFDFLGFTHYCTTTRDKRFKLGVKTSRKNVKTSQKAINVWLKQIRNAYQQKQIWKQLKVKLQGHYNYYGISGNFHSIKRFYDKTIYLAYKWLNRRSQKKSFNWNNFIKYLNTYPLPKPKLCFQIYQTW